MTPKLSLWWIEPDAWFSRLEVPMSAASEQERDAANPRIRPPLLFLGCLVLGLVLDRALLSPFALPESAWIRFAGGGLILLGIAAISAGFRNFSHAGTPVPGNLAVSALVTTGIHGLSRNPIYVGMFLFYVGIGLAARTPCILVLVLPIAVIMRYAVVAREESYLERRFGDAYRDYKARVRRWL
jgi:protein-S-isoprenylcysteine O-methyltransferase Ste14